MKIAWIGLGNMGAPMARRLHDAGHEVVVHDVSPASVAAATAAGLTAGEDARDAARGAEVVFTMLPDDVAVRSVLDGPEGVMAAVAPDTLVVDCSTIDIVVARELHESARTADVRFLDAPVSGGISGAVAGTLTVMVGGDAADLDALRPVIGAMARQVFHTGGPGTGQAAKICNNLILGINLAATCEGAVLAGRLGLEPQTFFDVASASSGDNWALRTWYPVPGVVETAPANRDFTGGFATALLLKDLGLALRSGTATSTELPFATAVKDRMQALSDAGLADRDCSILVGVADGSLDVAPGHASAPVEAVAR